MIDKSILSNSKMMMESMNEGMNFLDELNIEKRKYS